MSIEPSLWYRKRYRSVMAVNVRMSVDLADQLRELSTATGRSQQEIIRSAVEQYLRQQRQLEGLNPWARANLVPAARIYREIAPDERLPVAEGFDSTAVVRDLRGAR